MIVHTHGILLHHLRYDDHSIVVKIYTRQSGMKSFLVKGLHKKTSVLRPSHLQPLGLLDLVYEEKPRQSLHYIREARFYHPMFELPADHLKTGIALFMTEVLYRSIREEESNPALYSFIESTVITLDGMEQHPGMFPLWFLIRLSGYLGFLPLNNFSADAAFFDFETGRFLVHPPMHKNFLDIKQSEALSCLLTQYANNGYTAAEINLTKSQMIDALLAYYQFHLPGIGQIKSHSILHDVFRA